MTPGADGPTYSIKLNMNGRSYVAKRHHNKLRSLVDGLRARGYRVWRPFPEVEDMVRQAPVKVENSLVEALPFYEGFGYSIKSLASTMLKSTSAAHLRKKRSVQLEQMSARIDAFLKTVFLENDDLQYEQVVSQFFWEPLEKKLPVLLEEEGESDTEEEGGGAVRWRKTRGWGGRGEGGRLYRRDRRAWCGCGSDWRERVIKRGK